MSGSYMNTQPDRCVVVSFNNRRQRPAESLPASTSASSLSSVAERGGGQPSARRRPSQRRRQQHQKRPHSVLSQRISQVYELAADGRPACLDKAAVSPVLWLLCQTILVVLFALCCVFLTSGPAFSSRDKSEPLQTVRGVHPKPWMRLEFDRRAVWRNPGYQYSTTGSPFNSLICSTNGSSNQDHCKNMERYFQLTSGTRITIKQDAVYRINAAVTFQKPSNATDEYPVDISVMIDNKNWITCQEGFIVRYVHCTLFGIRFLKMNSVVSFTSKEEKRTIAAHGSSTYFEIEMR